ncbi:MAG: SpoIIE family protein phosphatase [Planctomycetaceae bacterium]|nr:SpoIIE family protein phosphatase [Planctomycetaceae bacterium]
MNNPLRVLLIDDDEDSPLLIRGLLTQSSQSPFELHWIATYDGGVSELKSGQYDVCLLDYRLGARDGVQLLKEAVKQGCRIPVILITGFDDDELVKEALQAGATDYLTKQELSGPVLTRSIRFAIDRRQGEEQRLAVLTELKAVSQHAGIGIWHLDRDFRIQSIVGQCPFGEASQPESILGKRLPEVIHDRDDIAKAHEAAHRGETTTMDIHHNKITYCLRVIPHHSEHGQVIGSVGVAVDVTNSRYLSNGLMNAREIQQKLFPAQSPEYHGLDIAGRCRPADAVGGDYYDFLKLEDGSLATIVADVSRHGFPSALIMSSLRRTIRNLARQTSDPAQILTEANTVVYEDTPMEWFVTAILATINPKSFEFSICGAGHQAYLFDPGHKTACIIGTGLPLGILEENPIESSHSSVLVPGQILLFFTDGIHEIQSTEGELFGLQRVTDLVSQVRHKSSNEIIDELFESALLFNGDAEPEDDMTAVVIKVE